MNGNNDEAIPGDARKRSASKSNPTSDDSQPSSSSNSSTSSSSSEGATNPISSANSEYCKQLENWLWKCYWQRTIAVSAYFTVLNQYYGGGAIPNGTSPVGVGVGQQQQQGRQNPVAGIRFNFNLFGNQLNNQNPQQQRVGVVGQPLTLVKVAPIWKRLVAEVIDFIILMVVKLLVTFAIVDNFDVIDFDNLDLSSFQEQDADLRISSLYELAFTISSELIILEIIHRFIACIVEGYCLSKSGCTPGKSLLNLRVIHAESIVPHPGNQLVGDVQYVLVAPASYLTFPRAFFRSAVKNFSLAFFFPLCFTLFHFDYSRTLYDMVGKSLVVENN